MFRYNCTTFRGNNTNNFGWICIFNDLRNVLTKLYPQVLKIGTLNVNNEAATDWRTLYRNADKSLARPGRKQATATEDFEFHISYL